MINNNERIAENFFLDNDVLDDGNLENDDVSSMSPCGITVSEIKSPLLLQNDEDISESIRSLNVK